MEKKIEREVEEIKQIIKLHRNDKHDLQSSLLVDKIKIFLFSVYF